MNRFIKRFIAGLLILGLSINAFADDLDILDTETPPLDSNILFIMDLSKSMDWGLVDDTIPANPADSRISVLRTALAALLADPEMKDINIGISSFAGLRSRGATVQSARGITYPVSSIDSNAQTILDSNPLFTHIGSIDPNNANIGESYLPPADPADTTRDYVGAKVPTTWEPKGGTPIVDSLFEAAKYFRGEDVQWGRDGPSKVIGAHPSTYKGLLEYAPNPGCGNYKSCLFASCDVATRRNCSASTNFTTIQAPPAVCTPNGTTRTTCSLGDTSCGNGNNCSRNSTQTFTRYCTGNALQLAACRSSHIGSWYGCKTILRDKEFGGNYLECKEDLTYWSCDRDQFSCNIPTCEHEVCPDVLTGLAKYKSPIKQECQNNGIVLLSDGLPTINWSAGYISSMVGAKYNMGCDTGSDAGRCGKNLTKYLANVDQSTATLGNNLPNDQYVNTHTIGLALSDPAASAYLEELADSGGGVFANATSTAGLVTAFKDAVFGIASRARSFSSSTYTVDTTNLLSHEEFVYVPVFDKKSGVVWPGNLKKFKRKNGKLYDADDNPATDNLGQLKDQARDYWSTTASTNAIKSGGFANLIDPVKRANGAVKVYTDNGFNGVSAGFTPLNKMLSNAKFGATVTTAHKQKLVKFILGENNAGGARHHMGDIIHSKPVYLSYGAKKVLYVGTNEGYLHAIDAKTGEEIFAYMPSSLLKNIDKQYKNEALPEHLYGVDGPITIWHDDKNSDHVVDAGEDVYLYFGLRRGGRSYYALKVTDPRNPELLWKIDNTTAGFRDLGFSWSKPVLKHMRYKKSGVVTANPEPVLVIGGGYVNDSSLVNELDNSGKGSDVYIVDAMTGEMRWKTPDAKIKYAVPGSIRALDISRNGSLDRLYFGDTGGNIWRVDFESTDLSSAKVNLFAELGSVTPPATSMRKFFIEPDVAIFKYGGSYKISISIGSGTRPKPLDAKGDDHFFVLFDENVFNVPSPAPATITKNDLIDATLKPALKIFGLGKKGWYMDLVGMSAEKVLSRALTYQNSIIFSSFGTVPVVTNACDSSSGNQTNLYILDLLTGGPVLDLDGNGTVSGVADHFKPISTGEIPGPAQIVFNNLTAKDGTGACSKGDCIRTGEIAVGRAPTTAPVSSVTLQRVFWSDLEK